MNTHGAADDRVRFAEATLRYLLRAHHYRVDSMTSPQDHDRELLEKGGTAAIVIRNKQRITQLFVERVRAMLADADQLSRPMTINTMPLFLTSLALALSPSHSRSHASENSNIALQHGTERAKLTTYSLSQLIREYQILREILQEVLEENAVTSPADWRTVHAPIDEAIAGAASSFVRVHEGVRAQFTATLTHDFRGPLSAAHNYVELIKRAGDRPEQRAHFVARALDNLKRLSKMVDDLLDASRTRSGERLIINPVQCNVTEMLRTLLDDLAEKEGDRFVLDSEPDVTGYVDVERLRQAAHNLAENAVKYGSPESPITVRLINPNGRIHLSVHNFGDPLSPEEKAVLFQAYQRTPSAEKSGKKGWGLGLVLVQAIAEAHGGTVAIASNVDEGTTFTLDILQDVRDLPKT
jgi:signal transduction histidine kinase